MQTFEQKQVVDRLERLLELDPPYVPPARQSSGKIPAWAIFALGVGATLLVAHSVSLFQLAAPQEPRPVNVNGVFLPSTDAFAQPLTINHNLRAATTTLTGVIDPTSMTAAYYLAMVLKNNGHANHEAEMHIRLPEGAAVSRATLWVNGVPQEAAFGAKSTVEQTYHWVAHLNRDPLLVTQIDERTISVKASPVMPGAAGMKLRIGFTAPLQPGSLAAMGELPQVIDRNFEDGKLDIHLESPTGMASSSPNALVTRRNHKNLLLLNLPSFPHKKNTFSVGRPVTTTRFAARATHSSVGGFIVATVEATTNPRLKLERTLNTPDCEIIADDNVAIRLSSLWAHGEIERLVKEGNTEEAVKIANAYRIVSAISGATVLERSSDYATYHLNRDMNQELAFVPHMQAATNGTIGPQGADATVITGVNTAGTVRVNNLAHMEDTLNRVGTLAGPIGASAVNWVTASSRDANLFDGSGVLEPLVVVPFLLPLLLFSFLPGLLLIFRGIKRGITHKQGAAKLAALGAGWLALGVLCPLVSQLLTATMIVLLWRRKTRLTALFN